MHRFTSPHRIKVINGPVALWMESISTVLIVFQANHV